MSELKAFVLRTEVLHLFRNFLKTVKQAPADAKGVTDNVVHGKAKQARSAA